MRKKENFNAISLCLGELTKSKNILTEDTTREYQPVECDVG
jgi:hypothetical protein